MSSDPHATLHEHVRQFFAILDIVEESDGGNVFRPTVISSCRAHDAAKLERILDEMRRLSGAKSAVSLDEYKR